jgi:hypothetical protein
MLPPYENSIVQAIYEYSRIPLWIFNDTFELKNTFICNISRDINVKLSKHINRLISKNISLDFDIISYENELYFHFSFTQGDNLCYLAGGPMLLSGIYHITEMKSLSFASDMNTKELSLLVENLPVVSLNSFSSCLNIMMLLLRKSALSLSEIGNYKYSNLQGYLNHSLIVDLFNQTPDSRIHTPYKEEIALLNCVKEGNEEMLDSLYKILPRTKYGDMTNNQNPIRQLFYGSIANTTLVTRYAIEGGLEEETAFILSDLYIKRMEKCNTLYELNRLNEKMAIDFTKRVAISNAAKQFNYTKPIADCIHYIYSNIHNKISLEYLAKRVNLTAKYYLFSSTKKQDRQLVPLFLMPK